MPCHPVYKVGVVHEQLRYVIDFFDIVNHIKQHISVPFRVKFGHKVLYDDNTENGGFLKVNGEDVRFLAITHYSGPGLDAATHSVKLSVWQCTPEEPPFHEQVEDPADGYDDHVAELEEQMAAAGFETLFQAGYHVIT